MDSSKYFGSSNSNAEERNESEDQYYDTSSSGENLSEKKLANPFQFTFSKEKADRDFKKAQEIQKHDNVHIFRNDILTSLDTSKNSFEHLTEHRLGVSSSKHLDNSKREIKAVEDSSPCFQQKLIEGKESLKLHIHTASLPRHENERNLKLVVKKVSSPKGFTHSSHFSNPVLQSLIPYESSSSSQDNNSDSSKTDFETFNQPSTAWRESDGNSSSENPDTPTRSTREPTFPTEREISSSIPVITIDESNTEPTLINTASNNLPAVSCGTESSEFVGGVVLDKKKLSNEEAITKSEETFAEPDTANPESALPIPILEPVPLPVVAPTPRKRGRPRKQVLPNPSPLVESWGLNAQQFVPTETPKESKRPTRSGVERRARKKKLEDAEKSKTPGSESTPKRRYTPKTPAIRKKKVKPVYVPKKRGPKPKKQHTELENIQNFEEETRMSASEGQGNFTAKSSALGDESQSSFITESGQSKSNVNKKGRMEVMTDGCKPITVQQIVEYNWPPASSLPHGEKPEGLMIQEQITEYLGVKSFKRKYPSIKRRPVEMEERNYLQENGFVTEKMCDMGLTAVCSADIIEIMYNDFPHKFDEYRKYTREKKAKEQRALREKQAAERADMDPLKEAVESAQSWNSEFNKMRRFKVLHVRPEMRWLTDGSPCTPFERLVINHAPDSSPLCVEADTWKMSLFSYECEISARTKSKFRNKVDPVNVWMFLVGSV